MQPQLEPREQPLKSTRTAEPVELVILCIHTPSSAASLCNTLCNKFVFQSCRLVQQVVVSSKYDQFNKFPTDGAVALGFK